MSRVGLELKHATEQIELWINSSNTLFVVNFIRYTWKFYKFNSLKKGVTGETLVFPTGPAQESQGHP